MTDPVSDMLTRIRNALIVKHSIALVPKSKIKIEILKVLKEEGYIKEFKIIEDGIKSRIEVSLKYHGSNKESVVRELNRVSKPSRRVYIKNNEIPRIRGGLGISIISTSKGIMTGSNARNQKLGGEFICTVM
jgi:small subunit ribosomal protein S8